MSAVHFLEMGSRIACSSAVQRKSKAEIKMQNRNRAHGADHIATKEIVLALKFIGTMPHAILLTAGHPPCRKMPIDM
jgi:nicotinic acid phosphoribosyltransferase